MNDALLKSSVNIDSLNGYIAAAMHPQYSTHRNCLPGNDSSPTEEIFDLIQALTPAQLSALDLELIESRIAHTNLLSRIVLLGR